MSKILAGKPGEKPQALYARGVKVTTIVLPRATVEQIRALQARQKKAGRP